MVDQESGTYRPRRVFIEPEPTPPPVPESPPAPEPKRFRAPAPPAAPNFDDEDTPKPLYRDEYAPWSPQRDDPTAVRTDAASSNGANGSNGHHGSNGSNGRSGSHAAAPGELEAFNSDDTQIRSFTFAPRTRRTGEETTTILARGGSSTRTRTGGIPPIGPEDLDEDEGGEDGTPIGERAKWALAIGVIAAVVVLGLAIGYAVLGLGDERAVTPQPSQTAGSVGPAPTSSVSTDPTTAPGGPLLSKDLVLTAAEAKRLDSKRTWKETLTQLGASDEAPVPACFGIEPADGQPTSQQKIIRVVSGSGKNAPSALHDATAYATTEEAAQAFTLASRTLGTCAAASSWIASGRSVRGVGDSSAGAVVAVYNGKAVQSHSVVVSRTGRIVNVFDASRPGAEAIAPSAAAAALGDVVKRQCGPAGGKCAGNPNVKDGPPPLGGDVPGYLAVGDLPPAAGAVAPWNVTPVAPPEEGFLGSSCENVDWTTQGAEQRSQRIYLHPDSGNAFFGVNTILLTQKDEKSASSLVEKIKKNWQTCKDVRQTATVAKPAKVAGVGAQDTDVTGYTTTVEQKGTTGSSKFRVGIVQAGNKVVYTFANPEGDYDFTDAQWDTIAVRAGQRVTQAP